MKAKLIYASPEDTGLAALREVLAKTEPLGLNVERGRQSYSAWRVLCNGEPLCEFTTLAKLNIWIDGFMAASKLIGYCN